MNSHYRYRVFGLTLESAIELPDLHPHAGPGDADVCIRLASVTPTGAGDERPVAVDGGQVVTIVGIARYEVRSGREILVDAEPGVPMVNVRLYLLGSALGLVLHQRGLLALHANAIAVDGRAIAFLGESGSGKSTLAAHFRRRGMRVITDDVCVVGDPDGSPLVLPGVPRLRLWREAVERIGLDPASLARSYAGDERWEKYDLRLDVADATPVELAALYVLERGETLTIAQIAGAEAVGVLASHTYRGAYLEQPPQRLAHMRQCIALAERIPIFVFRRSFEGDQIDREIDVLLKQFAALGTPSRAVG